MIRRIAIRKDWTISMSEFRNFAEKYQWKIDELEEENRKLKEQLERMKIDTMYDMKDINSLYKKNKKLKEDVDYRHHRAMVAERGWEDED